ncbi:MAG: phage tail tape measure protein [Synergistaceae bacterium]|jgi:TP901 family phage tail tape measure protein|nr:phage tail tape measure protein [Synergistaceae bacterium]
MQLGQISTKVTMDDSSFVATLHSVLGKANSFADSMKSLGGSMLMLTGPVVYGLKKTSDQLAQFTKTALSVGGGFESSMTRVAAISGATGGELVELTDKARELGATLPIMAQEAADAMGVLASRGYDAKKMLATVGDIVNLSIAQNYDLASTADLVSAALTNFQLDAKETARVADIFTQASNQSALSMGKLSNAFVYAAQPAAAMNMSIEELVAAMGVLADAGMQGEMIGTAMRSILQKVASSTKIMGVATRDAAGNFRKLNDIMADISKTGSGLDKFTEAFDVRSATAALALSKNVSRAAEQERKLFESTGATIRQVEKQLQTWENVVKAFLSRVESLYITVFDQIKSSAKETTSSLTGTMSRVEEWVAKTDIAGKSIGAFLEGLGLDDGLEGINDFLDNFDDEKMRAILDGFRSTGETIRDLTGDLVSLAETVPWKLLLSNLDKIVYIGAASFVGGNLLSGLSQATMAFGSLFGVVEKGRGAFDRFFSEGSKIKTLAENASNAGIASTKAMDALTAAGSALEKQNIETAYSFNDYLDAAAAMANSKSALEGFRKQVKEAENSKKHWDGIISDMQKKLSNASFVPVPKSADKRRLLSHLNGVSRAAVIESRKMGKAVSDGMKDIAKAQSKSISNIIQESDANIRLKAESAKQMYAEVALVRAQDAAAEASMRARMAEEARHLSTRVWKVLRLDAASGIKHIYGKGLEAIAALKGKLATIGTGIASGIGKALLVLSSPTGMFATVALLLGGMVAKSIADGVTDGLNKASNAAGALNDATEAAAKGMFTGFTDEQRNAFTLNTIKEWVGMAREGVEITDEMRDGALKRVAIEERILKMISEQNEEAALAEIIRKNLFKDEADAARNLEETMSKLEANPLDSKTLFDFADARDRYKKFFEGVKEDFEKTKIVDGVNLSELEANLREAELSLSKRRREAIDSFKANEQTKIRALGDELNELYEEMEKRINDPNMDERVRAHTTGELQSRIDALKTQIDGIRESMAEGAEKAGQAVLDQFAQQQKIYDAASEKNNETAERLEQGVKRLKDASDTLDKLQKAEANREKASKYDFAGQFADFDKAYKEIQEGLREAVKRGLDPKKANEYMVESTKNAIKEIVKEFEKSLPEGSAGHSELLSQFLEARGGVDDVSTAVREFNANVQDASLRLVDLEGYLRRTGGASSNAREEIAKLGQGMSDMIKEHYQGLAPAQRAKIIDDLEKMAKTGGNKYAKTLLENLTGGTRAAVESASEVLNKFKLDPSSAADAINKALEDKTNVDDTLEKLKDVDSVLLRIGETSVNVPKYIAQGLAQGQEWATKALDEMTKRQQKMDRYATGDYSAQQDESKLLKEQLDLYLKLEDSAGEAATKAAIRYSETFEAGLAANPPTTAAIAPTVNFDIEKVKADVQPKAQEIVNSLNLTLGKMEITLPTPNIGNFFTGIADKIGGYVAPLGLSLANKFKEIDLSAAGETIGGSLSNGIIKGLDSGGGLADRISNAVLAKLSAQLKNAGA